MRGFLNRMQDVVTQFCRCIWEQAEGCIQRRVRSNPWVKSTWSGEEEALPVWWPTWSFERGPKENCWNYIQGGFKDFAVCGLFLQSPNLCKVIRVMPTSAMSVQDATIRWLCRCDPTTRISQTWRLISQNMCKNLKKHFKMECPEDAALTDGQIKSEQFLNSRPPSHDECELSEYFLQRGKQRTHLEPVRTERAACMWARVGGVNRV